MGSQSKISRRGLLGAAAAVGASSLAGGAADVRVATARGRGRRRMADRPAARLPARGELLIRGGYVLTMDPALGDLPRGDIHVRDGAIVAVGLDLTAPSATVIDAQEMLILPGFVETHWHLWNSHLRGLVSDGPEDGYFPVVLRHGQQYTPEDAYRGVRLGLAEALYSGITTVHDWSHNIRGPAWADADLRALADVGIRARFSYGTRQGHPPDQTMDLADLARVQREWFGRPGDGLLTLGMAARSLSASPRGPAPPDVLKRDWEGARALELPITIHISPAGAIETLYDEGLLGSDIQLVHCLFATPRERELMVVTGAHLSSSPLTELRTLLGFPQLSEMLDAGVLTSLSIDTSALSANADMFQTMRVVLDVEHVRAKSDVSIRPRRILELATIDGARALGLADHTGSLTPGKRADLILVRTTDLNIAPVVDPVLALLHAAQPTNVDTVIVDGRVLKRGGQLTAIDPDQVVREATESLAGLRARDGSA
jgi:5-methylthioadenosine/S-adenosylhomocysteine deaminase